MPGMRRIVVGWKLLLVVVLTLTAAVPPFVVWLVTLGARGPSSIVGSRCSVVWSRAILRVLGIRPRVEGRPRGRRYVVAANHLSYLDIWVLAALAPSAFITKREVSSWPVFGAIAVVAGTLFVDRENSRSLVRTSRAMEQHLRRGLPLILFAEGRATCGDRIYPFMPSLFEPAARLGVPCYTATLSYGTPDPAPPSDTICWWGPQDFFPHFFRLLRLPRIEASVRYSETPIVAHDRKELARRLHEQAQRDFEPVRQVALADPG